MSSAMGRQGADLKRCSLFCQSHPIKLLFANVYSESDVCVDKLYISSVLLSKFQEDGAIFVCLFVVDKPHLQCTISITLMLSRG